MNTAMKLKKPELYDFKTVPDDRGDLHFLEELKDVPFEVKRLYWIHNIPEQQVRGGHAHRSSSQVIICLKGCAEVVLEDPSGEMITYTLSKPNQGLLIPPMWWGKMLFQEEALLLGMASDEFSESDYIRDKNTFYAQD